VFETAELREHKLSDIVFMGLRATVGVIFIVHGYGKFGNEQFIGWMGSMGISPEFAMIIAAGELVPGILLIIGVVSRISAAILAAIMVGAIFVIKEAAALTGDGGVEFDLVLLAACLVFMVMGPGRISLAAVISRLPRPIH